MRPLLILLALALIGLQWRLWNRDGGVPEVRHLQQQIAEQQAHNESLEKNNAELIGGIEGLKNDPDELERRAREDLGLIHSDETWVTVEEKH